MTARRETDRGGPNGRRTGSGIGIEGVSGGSGGSGGGTDDTGADIAARALQRAGGVESDRSTGREPGRAGGRESNVAARPLTVLLAEDEESFVDALVIGLGNEGFRVVVARDGQEALRLFDEVAPDLVLLDMMLPKLSGIDVCRTIRTRSHVPIIIVTAKAAEIDTVVALEVGADDYVTKPYRLRELVARMRAVLRRAAQAAKAGGLVELDGDRTSVVAGEVTVDLDQRRVFVRGDEVTLRRKEFELLHLLTENAGRVLTRDTLIDRVWGTDYIGDTKTLDVHVKRLRSVVEEDPANPRLITTVRGVGYRFDVPSSSRPPR